MLQLVKRLYLTPKRDIIFLALYAALFVFLLRTPVNSITNALLPEETITVSVKETGNPGDSIWLCRSNFNEDDEENCFTRIAEGEFSGQWEYRDMETFQYSHDVIILYTYRMSYLQTEERMTGVSTVRASNVLGGGDHIQSRLIPSILNAIAAGKPVELRNPHQTRPWQSVLDALNGYLTIGRLMAQEPQKYSGEWNIGPTLDGIKDVLWVVNKMQTHYANAQYVVGDTFDVAESKTLGLDITKSLKYLDWEPILSCDKMLYNIVEFFKLQQAGVPERKICEKQIRSFFERDD